MRRQWGIVQSSNALQMLTITRPYASGETKVQTVNKKKKETEER
jgi:hypothetical protein